MDARRALHPAAVARTAAAPLLLPNARMHAAALSAAPFRTVSRKDARTRMPRVPVIQDTATTAPVPASSSSSSSEGPDPPATLTASAAMAAKISAARELARRLAEERQAALALASTTSLTSMDLPDSEALRTAEGASVAAAAQAARADAVSRALRKADSGKDQLQRLKTENDVLKNLLIDLAQSRDTGTVTRARLESILSSAMATGQPLTISSLLRGQEEGEALREGAEATEVSELPRAAPAPAQAPEPAQPRPPAVAPTKQDLILAAEKAVKSGRSFFTFPSPPVPVSQPMYLYYNRAQGPLAGAGGGKVQFKCGTNKWETIDVLDMAPAKEDLPSSPGQEWWFIPVDLPEDLFRIDWVFMDSQTGLVDNNQYQDFTIPLSGGPTEEQLLERRMQALAAAERWRLSLLQQEEEKLRDKARTQEKGAEAKAREQARSRLASKHLEAAKKLAAKSRLPDLKHLQAADSLQGVYCWTQGQPVAGQKAQLVFNKSHNQGLRNSSGLLVHFGVNGWMNQEITVQELSPLPPAEAAALNLPSGSSSSSSSSWFSTWIQIPRTAAAINFVVSDRDRRNWDNNNNKDYHTRVQGTVTEEQLAQELLESIRLERAEADEREEDRAAAQAVKKLQAKVESLIRRRAARHQVLFTVPSTPKAGQPVDVYYNPELTPLRGRPDVYVRIGWDRSSARQQDRSNCLPLTPERATGGLGFQKVTVQVPTGAWGMDLVFTDTPEGRGGFYDDNGGLGYHVPVETPPGAQGTTDSSGSRGAGRKSTLRVVHVAVEMAPIAKVGGMGDVVTALGRAVQEEGHSVEVVLPKYDCINYSQVEGLQQQGSFQFGGTKVRVWKGLVEQLPTTFLEPENGHFWVGCIYGRNDDALRFRFFCEAVAEYLKSSPPDIIHCHDWPTAPMAWGARGGAKCVFTIHNLSYGVDLVGRAMAAAEAATTVSPTYAREISGHGAIAPHLSKLYGIRNGIDPELWDPESDPYLPQSYGPETASAGKEAARKLLRQKLNLAQVDVPIVSVVTRLVAQKGIHLIKHAAWRAVERGGQFVLLGSAPDGRVQGEFNALRDQLVRQYHDRAALVFTYDEPLSHLIYAASDLFLVPSMFEPCGLTQMIAMNYGALPVVRRTGGLADTVFDIDHDEARATAATPGGSGVAAQPSGRLPNGFVFEGTDAPALDYALNRAMATYFSDRKGFRDLQSRIMTQDWSWTSPALDYVEVYYKALRG